MSANEFDELILHKFDDGDIAFNPGNWERMSAQLAKAEQPKKNNLLAAWPALAGIAAALAMLISLPFMWFQNSGEGTLPVATHTTQQKSVAPKQTIANTTLQRAIKAEQPNTLLPAPRQKYAVTIVKNNPAVSTPQSQPAKAEAAVGHADAGVAKPIPTSQPNLAGKQEPFTPKEVNTAATQTKRTSINLVGGFNYNSANTGFAIGASASRKLGDKLYLEGNIAYVNSNMGGNSGNSNALASYDNFDATPGTNSAKEEEVSKPVQYNLSYLQFSPVVGYSVSERFTIGAGPDLQRLLNDSYYFETAIPALDFGVLGKAEYSISEKLKAGILYRAGLNNALQNTQVYMERNYMQVQLRYAIFDK